MSHDRRKRARSRRASVQTFGLLVIAAVTTAACIFDEGNGYQGGGRIDHGAKVNSPSSSSTGTSTSTSSTSTSSASSSADAAPADSGAPVEEDDAG